MTSLLRKPTVQRDLRGGFKGRDRYSQSEAPAQASLGRPSGTLRGRRLGTATLVNILILRPKSRTDPAEPTRSKLLQVMNRLTFLAALAFVLMGILVGADLCRTPPADWPAHAQADAELVRAYAELLGAAVNPLSSVR